MLGATVWPLALVCYSCEFCSTLTFQLADNSELLFWTLDRILSFLLQVPFQRYPDMFLAERLCFDLHSFPCLLITISIKPWITLPLSPTVATVHVWIWNLEQDIMDFWGDEDKTLLQVIGKMNCHITEIFKKTKEEQKEQLKYLGLWNSNILCTRQML